MQEYYYVADYYLKGLDPDEIRGIWGDILDCMTPLKREIILDAKNHYKNVLEEGLLKSVEQIEKYTKDASVKFLAINDRMIKNKRPPLFENPFDLVKSTEWRDVLLSFLPEGECNKIVGCKSFDEYVPLVYTKK